MLNSKFAPIIAGTVIGLMVILGLGWYFGIQPHLSHAAALKSQAQQVRSNATTLEASTANIQAAQARLDKADDLGVQLDLNAPSAIELTEFRARVSAALVASGVQLVDASQAIGQPVDGWKIDPTTLPSTALALEFASGQVSVADRVMPPPTPVVVPPAEPAPLIQGLVQLPFTFQVAGTPAEIYNFMALMSNDADRIFQVYDVDMVARPKDSADITGVAKPVDGDALAKIAGVLYFLGLDEEPDSNEKVPPFGAPGGTPFIEPAAAQPQAGG